MRSSKPMTFSSSGAAHSASRRRLATASLVVLFALSCMASGCREEDGAVTVASIAFEGNKAFDDGTLKDLIVTEAKGLLPWARSRYFNRSAFDADLERLRAFYIDRGYPSVTIGQVDVAFNDTRDQVRITIGINEGNPLLVERVEVTGVDALEPEVAEAVRAVSLKAGEPLDRQILLRSREQAAFELRDRGYPDAQVEVADTEGSASDRRVITFTAVPGKHSTFGIVSAVGLDDVGPSVVRRTLAFRVGDTYRESQVLESQRRLAALGVFDFAHVGRTRAPADDAPAPARASADTEPVVIGSAAGGDVPMSVTVAEGKPTRLRVGVGYGTEDGPRGSLHWQHANFLGAARRLSADAKYSQRLREIGLDLVQPYLFSRAISARAHLGASWTRDLDYSARRIGGRGSLEYRGRSSRGLDREPLEHVIRGTYTNQALQYGIEAAVLDDVTQFDEFVALGFDPVTGSGRGRVASLGLDLERNVLDRPIDPHAGYSLALHLERAAPWLGRGTYDYSEVLADARGYLPVGPAVVAGRLRAGALVATESVDVPFSARYFLGGSSSLRGWGRFQVAPLTVDGLPIGGRSVLESSLEVRFPISGSFGAVVFADAGNVWADRSQMKIGDVRINVGPGLRWTSPVGVVRGDFGYQLTPIEGLVIDGQPERRQWRVHFSIGEAF